MTGSIRFGNWVWDPNTLELRNGCHIATLEPRVAQLFEYLVEHQGELLSHHLIVEAVWEGRVVSDEAVRRAVFNLRQALAIDGADSYIRTIHKKGYIASFPLQMEADQNTPAPALSVSHAEPISPPIQAMPIDGGSAAFVRPGLRPTAARITAALAIVAFAWVMLAQLGALREPDYTAKHSSIPVQGPSTIAVLPFVSLSEAADTELMADGLVEELHGTLERNRNLRITASRSASQFKGQNHDVRDIGERLGVRYVLEGSVRHVDDQVRVHVQLVDADTGSQLWAEAYDRVFADWFALQRQVALEVAYALQLLLQQSNGPVLSPGGTSSVEAHLELLRARQLMASRSLADTEQAIEHLQLALILDSNYALAYARLADAILIQAESSSGIGAVRPVVAPLLDKALTLDPGLGEAYALRSQLTDDAETANRDLRRGLELNPSYARAYELLATLQSASFQQLDLAIGSIDSAIALDPLSPGNFNTKALLLMWQGDWEAAGVLNRRALELNPQFRAALVQLSSISAIQGSFADAIEFGERAVALDPRAATVREQLVLLYLSVGEVDSALEVSTPLTAFCRYSLLWAKGDIADAARMIYGRLLGPIENYAPESMSQVLLQQAFADKDIARARTWMSTALPFTKVLPSDVRGWRLYAYANMVQLLVANGEKALASALQVQISDRMITIESRYPRYAILHDQVRAILLANEGRREEAIDALERSYTPAPRAFWKMVLANPAIDDSMHAMPRFQALLARLETYAAAERTHLEKMRRDGQIPDRSRAASEARAGPAP
jgi:TolB-like protein/DNA-binding winged helix-turn-helix (wHTH) protein